MLRFFTIIDQTKLAAIFFINSNIYKPKTQLLFFSLKKYQKPGYNWELPKLRVTRGCIQLSFHAGGSDRKLNTKLNQKERNANDYKTTKRFCSNVLQANADLTKSSWQDRFNSWVCVDIEKHREPGLKQENTRNVDYGKPLQENIWVLQFKSLKMLYFYPVIKVMFTFSIPRDYETSSTHTQTGNIHLMLSKLPRLNRKKACVDYTFTLRTQQVASRRLLMPAVRMQSQNQPALIGLQQNLSNLTFNFKKSICDFAISEISMTQNREELHSYMSSLWVGIAW